VNHATTGHKLQGKTVKSLVIAEWSKVENWAYVVLSRVKTLSGLFLMIPEDINFGPAEDYLDMMRSLRQRILATPDQEHPAFFSISETFKRHKRQPATERDKCTLH
jgi:hypothetical protein